MNLIIKKKILKIENLFNLANHKLNMILIKSHNNLNSIAVRPEQEIDIVSRYPVKSIITVNKDLKVFLIYSNVDIKLIKQTNSELGINLLDQQHQFVKSHVGIASAITAYARIEMMKYKTIPGIIIYYSDTDSIITNKELPTQFVGPELGQVKDELNGGWIKEAYFFGVKKYAYIDNNDKVKTIFSGISRNSLTWEEVIKLSKKETLHKNLPDQFFKSLSKLEISIKHKPINIKFDSDKQLIANRFEHIKVSNSSNNVLLKMTRNFIRKIAKFLGRLNKKKSLGHPNLNLASIIKGYNITFAKVKSLVRI